MIRLTYEVYVAPELIERITVEWCGGAWHVLAHLRNGGRAGECAGVFPPASEHSNAMNDARIEARKRAAELAEELKESRA